ncbi:hypothetical protein SODALDRAFT_320156 [Sodiomyces alkalinus F11]|uniref:Zn(2)-C6 fungal-type domain-containing protein n=1 Tax=Sodiomyces alkalinus (strain CBS 110278 / VKM F-3762 / F11) TaxID=1314773 RepID=A0A3N2QAI6_SODAK|nr:hypothetical protein SODALDRAFT_320156 [Sodiomyces alkalinus F11]ROT43772.1 hypothetical protein SODALDRAFT_320156 [Sodiomyces alkalinus F11]
MANPSTTSATAAAAATTSQQRPWRAPPPPTKPCHNCRRRRLRCDRSYPSCHKCSSTGQDCLGYGKLFRWAVQPVSVRGKRAESDVDGDGETGSTSAASRSSFSPDVFSSSSFSSSSFSSSTTASQSQQQQQQQSHYSQWNLATTATTPVSSSDPASPAGELPLVRSCSPSPSRPLSRSPSPPAPWTLVDPVFQDAEYPYRYYLSYFTTRVCKDLVSHDIPERNPFRALIPLTKSSPLLQHIIVAASAAHLSNLTRPPLAPAQRSALANANTNTNTAAEASRRALLDALVAKQKALRLLNEAITNIDTVGGDVVLAAVLFFINVELIESGKHGWKAHLEGAGRIMTFLSPDDSSSDPLRDYILSDCFIYYILASAFMPTAPAQFSYFQSAQISSILERAAANSYLCCPPQVLQILLDAARLSNIPTTDDHDCDCDPDGSAPPCAGADAIAQGALRLMQRAQSLDLDAWAQDVRSVPYLQNVPIESRLHAGSAHRLASCLYILQAIPSVARFLPPDAAETLERDIMFHLSSIPEGDPNFKATTWPTFIAGAEARDRHQQAWVMNRLQRLVLNCPWGFIYTAMDALQVIWDMQRGEGEESRSWVQMLKDPDMNFLIV